MLPRRQIFFRDSSNHVELLALISLIIVQVPPQHTPIFHWAGVVLSLGFLYFGLKFVV